MTVDPSDPIAAIIAYPSVEREEEKGRLLRLETHLGDGSQS